MTNLAFSFHVFILRTENKKIFYFIFFWWVVLVVLKYYKQNVTTKYRVYIIWRNGLEGNVRSRRAALSTLIIIVWSAQKYGVTKRWRSAMLS
jgi:hypothetical protein